MSVNLFLRMFDCQSQTLVEAIHSSLLLDGESVYSLVANPFLLLLARVILTKCSTKMDSLQVRLSFCPNQLPVMRFWLMLIWSFVSQGVVYIVLEFELLFHHPSLKTVFMRHTDVLQWEYLINAKLSCMLVMPPNEAFWCNYSRLFRKKL